MMKITELDHIGVACLDADKNAAWYQSELGFELIGKFLSGERYVYFLKSPADKVVYEMYTDETIPADAQGKVDHIAYVSGDIESDYKKYADGGYDITTNGIEFCPFWENGVRYFKIRSACGEQIEFCAKV